MLSEFGDVLRCPVCHGRPLSEGDGEGSWAACPACEAAFPSLEGVPFLMKPETLALFQDSAAGASVDAASDEDVTRANVLYHDQFAAEYEHDASTLDAFVPGGHCQRRIQQTLRRAGERSGGGLLVDVCCGTGNLLAPAQESFDRCLGIDVSKNMMRIAQGRGFSVLGGDATNLPLADGAASCVTGFGALHHVLDYPAAAREMARVLRDGGTFYTDWDPNGHVTHEGWAVRLAVNLLKLVRRVRSSARIPESSLQILAEVHHHRKEGFRGERVGEVLRDCGFRQVAVICHINPPSFDRPGYRGFYGAAMMGLKAASFIWPSSRNVCPWVAVLAEK